MDLRFVPPEEQYVFSHWENFDAIAKEGIYLGALEGFPYESTMDFMKATIAQGIPFLLAVDEKDCAVGWCDAQPKSAAVGYLGMGLAPAYRSQGIGTRLLSALLEKARAFGYTELQLDVRPGNCRAIRLYKKLGFVQTGVVRDGLTLGGVTEDVLQMRLLL